MESLDYSTVTMNGDKAGTIALDSSVYAGPIKPHMVHEVVCWQLAARRQGTHSALTRAEVRGGGRKPWRQKGRGTARAGSNTSPVWVGGGVSHGPKPRDYSLRTSKRTRRQALCSVLSDKVRCERLVVLEELSLNSGKTKELVEILHNLGLSKYVRHGGITLILDEQDELISRAASNLKKVVTLKTDGVNVYDLWRLEIVVTTRRAVEALAKRLGAAAVE